MTLLLYGARLRDLQRYTLYLSSIMDFNTTTLEMNNIIKGLIQGDEHLSDLIVAEDGPGNTLVIRSLIDGVDAVTDLEVGATFAAADQWSGVSDATLALVHTANGYTAAQIAGLDTVAELNTWVTNNVANFNNHSDAAVAANTDDLDAAAAALYAGFDDAMGQEAVLSNLDVSVTTRGDVGTDEVQSIDVSALTTGVGVAAAGNDTFDADGSIEITVDGQVFTVDYAATNTVANVVTALEAELDTVGVTFGSTDTAATDAITITFDSDGERDTAEAGIVTNFVEIVGADSTADNDNTITDGTGNDTIVLSTDASSDEQVVLVSDGELDVIVNFEFGAGGDTLDVTNYTSTADVATTAATIDDDYTAAGGSDIAKMTDGEVLIDESVAGVNDTLALIQAAFTATDTGATAAGDNGLYVVVDANEEVATIYAVEDGTAIGDVTVTEVDTIHVLGMDASALHADNIDIIA